LREQLLEKLLLLRQRLFRCDAHGGGLFKKYLWKVKNSLASL